jgi:hypothetical protein
MLRMRSTPQPGIHRRCSRPSAIAACTQRNRLASPKIVSEIGAIAAVFILLDEIGVRVVHRDETTAASRERSPGFLQRQQCG